MKLTVYPRGLVCIAILLLAAVGHAQLWQIDPVFDKDFMHGAGLANEKGEILETAQGKTFFAKLLKLQKLIVDEMKQSKQAAAKGSTDLDRVSIAQTLQQKALDHLHDEADKEMSNFLTDDQARLYTIYVVALEMADHNYLECLLSPRCVRRLHLTDRQVEKLEQGRALRQKEITDSSAAPEATPEEVAKAKKAISDARSRWYQHIDEALQDDQRKVVLKAIEQYKVDQEKMKRKN